MSVYELLVALSKYPPETQVYFPPVIDEEGESQQYEVVGVEEDRGAVVLVD